MKFKRGNIHNIIFCLLALLPLVLFLVSYISTSFNFDYLNTHDGNVEIPFATVIYWNSNLYSAIVNSNFLGLKSLHDFLYSFGIFNNEIFEFVFCYFGYLVILETFDLVFLAVYGFIRLIRKWITKMGGDL